MITIILELNYTGFCFKKFRYLGDDELIKNYLDSSFLDKVMRDDYGGLPPRFYFIKGNPTTYEIFKTLEHIVNNYVNTTADVKLFDYMGKDREQVTTKSLYLFETLKKYYTIKEATDEVVIGGNHDKNGKYIQICGYVIKSSCDSG